MEEKALAKVEKQELGIVPENSFDKMIAMGDHLVKTGFLPKAITTGAQAAAIVMAGRELGIGTMESLRSINVIQGKPTIPPQLMLALAYRHIKGFKAHRVEGDNNHVTWVFQRPDGEPHRETFTMEDARKQGLADKHNWKAMPQIMLDWRCIAAGLRRVCPDVVLGLYTAEEINPNVNIIDAETGEVSEDTGANGVVVENVYTPASAPASTEPTEEPKYKVITKPQMTRMIAIAKSNGWTMEQMTKVRESFGYASAKDITTEHYDLIVEKFQNPPKDDKANG